MSTVIKEKAISIEYLPSENELDRNRPLIVGEGLTDIFTRTEDLGYQTFFGVKRYMCGLDVELLEYDNTLPPAVKEAKIKDIQETIARLERFFGKGTLDPTNEKHWSKIKLNISRKTTNLDLSDPKNELIYHCIKAGGFKLVAPSVEQAQDEGAKFYLIEPVEFAEYRIAPTEQRNKAISALQKVYETKSFDEMFYLGKYLLPAEKGYDKRTPKALLYEDLDKFLNGEVVKQSKSACARQFMEAIKLPKDILVITCLVKDGLYMGILYTNQHGELKNGDTGGVYGTTVERATAHLKNPAYEHELENLKTRVESKWS